MAYLKRVVRAGLLALCAAGFAPIAAQAQGALGANYNDRAEEINYRDLERSNTRWVRLFLPMPAIDRGGAAAHAVVKKTLELNERGYKTVLTLKMAYVGTGAPPVGSDAYKKDIARLDAVLPLVMGKVDMLVIGADPFLENPVQFRTETMNLYYEAVAKHAIAYRTQNCAGTCKTRLYMGALRALESGAERTKVTDRWMEFVRATPELDGVAIQPHVDAVDTSRAYLKYILPRMRAEQKFVVTDFSIVQWFEQNIRGNIPPAFADKYQAPRNAQNWQIVKAALETPFSKVQWDEFLSQSPWYEKRKTFLADQMKIFRDRGRLAVATYPFLQGAAPPANLSPGAAAWTLNGMVARRTVKKNPDGSSAFTYGLIDAYRALQQP